MILTFFSCSVQAQQKYQFLSYLGTATAGVSDNNAERYNLLDGFSTNISIGFDVLKNVSKRTQFGVGIRYYQTIFDRNRLRVPAFYTHFQNFETHLLVNTNITKRFVVSSGLYTTWVRQQSWDKLGSYKFDESFKADNPLNIYYSSNMHYFKSKNPLGILLSAKVPLMNGRFNLVATRNQALIAINDLMIFAEPRVRMNYSSWQMGVELNMGSKKE